MTKKKLLDEDNEFVLTVDSVRSLSATPSLDGMTVVISVEDPMGVSLVEVTQLELGEFIDGLTELYKGASD